MAAWRIADHRWSGQGAGPRFGYAAITWGGNDRAAIDDIAAVGFRGIQLRGSAVTTWQDKPEELKELLARRGLSFVALSSGSVSVDPAVEATQLATHARQAEFVRRVGGSYLQVTDDRPRGREVTAEDYRRLGRLLTEIGKRTADVGIPLGYHNHMGALGQAPDEIARILDAADPRYVKLELDTAHYQAGGGDPVEAIRTYANRLLFVHLKDLQQPIPDRATPAYRFVELGRGRVDVPGVLAALSTAKFTDWIIVELDAVPEPGRTPKESALIARAYLEGQGRVL